MGKRPALNLTGNSRLFGRRNAFGVERRWGTRPKVGSFDGQTAGC
jgi:hypothetical protein